jgi:prevent-host-death family protein
MPDLTHPIQFIPPEASMSFTVSISQAKSNLSRLVDQAAQGQDFIITKAGKPLVRVVALEALSAYRRLGFMVGQGVVTADVKSDFFVAEIKSMAGTAPSGRPPE